MTFAINAKNRKTGDEILNVKEITADYDFGDGLKIMVNDIKLAVNHNTINELQEMTEDAGGTQKSEKENAKSSDAPPLGLLSEFQLNNLEITLPDAKLRSRIENISVNFNKGTGKITSITATHDKDDLRFINIPEIALRFSEKFFSQELKNVSIRIEDPAIKLNQDLLNAFKNALPQSRQAQMAPPKKETSNSSSPLSMLEAFSVNNFNLEVIGKTNLSAKMNSLLVDMKEGKGRIDNMTASFPNSEVMSVENILLRFDQNALIAGKDAQLSFSVKGTEVNITQSALDAFKGLPNPPKSSPDDETKDESNSSPLKQLKSVSMIDTRFLLHPQGVMTEIDNITANINEGQAQIGEINSSLIKNGKKVLRVEEITVGFDPEKLNGPEKPELNIAVIDTHLRVSNELLNNFKQEAQEAGDEGEEKAKEAPTPLPVVISRILIGDAKVSFLDYPGIGKQKHLTINEIFGNIYNITLEPGTPLGSFAFNATFEGDSKFMTDGSLDLAAAPLEWSANWKLLNFDMRKLNKELRARIPLTFSEGVLDFYGEAIQQDDKIVGYVKPVLEEGEYFGNEDEFKGVRHFLAETFATFTNWIFERNESDTVATQIPFVIEDGKFDTKLGEAAWNAIKHGLTETDKVERGLEEDYQLKEAQEED